MNQMLYTAYAKLIQQEEWQNITLHGNFFFANLGLMELFVEKSKEKHPDWMYKIEPVIG